MDRWEMSTHILSGLLASGHAGNERSAARAAVRYADALIDALGEDPDSGKQESSTRPQADEGQAGLHQAGSAGDPRCKGAEQGLGHADAGDDPPKPAHRSLCTICELKEGLLRTDINEYRCNDCWYMAAKFLDRPLPAAPHYKRTNTRTLGDRINAKKRAAEAIKTALENEWVRCSIDMPTNDLWCTFTCNGAERALKKDTRSGDLLIEPMGLCPAVGSDKVAKLLEAAGFKLNSDTGTSPRVYAL